MTEPSFLGAGLDAYNSLSPEMRVGIAKAVGSLMSSAAKPISKRALRWAVASPEEKAVELALRNAIALTVATRPALEDAGLIRALAGPGFTGFILQILDEPLRSPDVVGFEEALDDSIFDVGSVGDSPATLLEELRQAFVGELRKLPETRELYALTRLDQMADTVVRTHDLVGRGVEATERVEETVRDVSATLLTLKERMSPPGQSWATTAVAGMLRGAREAMVAGRLDEAEADLTGQLAVIRCTEPSDRARGRHEQGVLLSLAQVSQRKGDRPKAIGYFQEAQAIGPFDERNRYIAGSILMNFGRDSEARRVLDPHDGTIEWRAALAIACLSAADYHAFQAIWNDDEDVTEPDLLLALVRYHTERQDLFRADHFARRLLARGLEDPTDRFRATEAGMAVLGLFVEHDKAEYLDVVFWLDSLRGVFHGSEEAMAPAPPVLQTSVLARRAEFHRLLLEQEQLVSDFHALLRMSPGDAVYLAANGVPDASAEDLTMAAEAARDPVLASLIRAHALIAKDDWNGAAGLLPTIHGSAEGDVHNLIVALEVECHARLGTEYLEVLPLLDQIEAEVPRLLAHASILAATGNGEQALAIIREALERDPKSLALLRASLVQGRALLAEAKSETARATLSGELGALSDRLVKRLPCPEHRILRALVLAQIGDHEGAFSEVVAVEHAGYETRETTELRARLALELHRLGAHADALKRLYNRFDSSSRVGLAAAHAAIRAGRYAEAQDILDPLRSAADREASISAHRMQAVAVEAQGQGIPAAREEAVRILLDGYDDLGGPIELAGPLFFFSIGTSYDRVAHERVARDHGSFANLPGVVAMPVEEAVELMKKDQEGGRVRAQMLMAGVLPFEIYADLSPRNAAYLWFAHREGKSLMLVDPPRFPGFKDEPALPDSPGPLLLDRTALLMLSETGLVDAVLGSSLNLAISTEIVDWIIESEASLRADYRPTEHERLQELIAIIDSHPHLEWNRDNSVDDALVASLGGTLAWADAFEIALATRDGLRIVDDFLELERLPAEHRDKIVLSADLLSALVRSGRVTYAQAAAAEAEAPSTFPSGQVGASVSLEHPLLFALSTAEGWNEAGLLSVLADVVPRVVVSPLAERHLREKLTEQEAYRRALSAVTGLRQRVTEAVETGRIRVLPQDVRIAERSRGEGDNANGELPRREPDGSATTDSQLRSLTSSVEQLLEQAKTHGMSLWTDDAATHLYLDPLGPLVRNLLPVALRSHSLRGRYPEISIVRTLDVLDWLERNGNIPRAHHLEVLADLVQHRRVFAFSPALLASAAAQGEGGGSEKAADILSGFGSLPSDLTQEALPRFVTPAMSSLARAIEEVWFSSGAGADKAGAVARLITAAGPWFVPSNPAARHAGRNFWLGMAGRLFHHIGEKPEELIRVLLDAMTQETDVFRACLAELWSALELFDRLQAGLPEEGHFLTSHAAVALLEAMREVELDDSPIVPLDVLRLIAPRLGIGLGPQAFGEGTIDSEAVRFRISVAKAQQEAVRVIETIVGRSNDEDEAPGPANIITVTTTAEVIGDEQRNLRAPYDVELLFILPQLGAPAARAVLASLEAYYRTVGQPELASLISKCRSAATGDPGSVELAWRDLYRDLLNAPWTWVAHDLYRAFFLLREAPFDHIRSMAGEPESWTVGETITGREERVRGSISKADEFFARVQKTWGPFRVAAVQAVSLATQQDASASTTEDVIAWVRKMVWGQDPYSRVVIWFLLSAILRGRPDLRDATVGTVSFDEDGLGAYLRFDGTYGELLSHLLEQWVQCELSPPAVGESDARRQFGLPETGPVGLPEIAQAHTLLARIHASVARLVFRAVITDQHFAEATERGEAVDAGGDLLLVAHELTRRFFNEIMGKVVREGAAKIVDELESVALQPPLSEGRHVVGELFTPDAMGVGPNTINPYLTLLLALLEVNESTADGSGPAGAGDQMALADSPSDETGKPFWWSEDVARGLQSLAVREPSSAVAYLENLSQQPGTLDRFETLLLGGAEGWARRILDIYIPASLENEIE
jgi:tetratricopeptide (TPR) repeat protein